MTSRQQPSLSRDGCITCVVGHGLYKRCSLEIDEIAQVGEHDRRTSYVICHFRVGRTTNAVMEQQIYNPFNNAAEGLDSCVRLLAVARHVLSDYTA